MGLLEDLHEKGRSYSYATELLAKHKKRRDHPQTLPSVRIRSPRARRRSINRTATSQEHKINITSGNNAYIPELYGLCSPKPHMFAVGMDGNDLIFGLWYGFGEIEEYTEILINDAAVPGAVTVEEHKGTTAQTASTILSNLSGYTHTLVIDVNGTNRGIAYLAFRVPPGAVDGFPKVTVKIKGNCEIEDTRTPVTEYSDLPALCFRHWLKTTGVGPEFSVLDSTFETLADFNEEVPGDAWQASHNYSVGDFATPTGANTKFRIYEVTTDAGSSGAAEPSPWDDTLGNTTVDDGITWTCRDGRRYVCGMVMDVKADIDSWIETWRTACGCMVIFGESGIEVIPDKARATDHTFLHALGQILESPLLQLKQTRLKDRPTAVQVIYTNTSGEPWRDGTDARAAAAGVDAGTTPERLSVIKAPWIHRKAQAVRFATERLNAASLTDLGFQLYVFDEGLKVKAGDVIEATHPIGLSAKKMRVLDASAMLPGRWMLDLWEYDPAVYSDYVVSEPTYVDFGLNTGQVISKVFTSIPTTPYKIGDIWTAGPAGDIKRCSTARTSGAYQAGDWELASDYDTTSENTAADIVGQGNLATQDVVTANQVNTATLSAIVADLGTITAGTITGALIRTASGTTRVELNASDNRLNVYESGDLVAQLGYSGGGKAFRVDYPTDLSDIAVYLTSASQLTNLLGIADSGTTSAANYPPVNIGCLNNDKVTVHMSGDSDNYATLNVVQNGTNYIINTNVTGCYCTKAGVWHDASSRDIKENFEDIEILKFLVNVPIKKYNYISEKRRTKEEVRAHLIRKRKTIKYYKKHENETGNSIDLSQEKLDTIELEFTELQNIEKKEVDIQYPKELIRSIPKHISPMAEDLYDTFGLGNDKSISAKDLAGIALQAVKELLVKVEALEIRIKQLEKQ